MTLHRRTQHVLPMLAASLLTGACHEHDGAGAPGASAPTAGASDGTGALVGLDGPWTAGQVVRLDAGLDAAAGYTVGLDGGLALDYFGNLYRAGRGGDGPAVRVFARASRRDDRAPFDPLQYDRGLRGPATGLSQPRGVQVAHAAGLLLVADAGHPGVLVYGTTAGGEAPPLAVVTLPVPPSDVHLDEAADRLFVALSDGTVAVVDGFVAGGLRAEGARRLLPVDAAGEPLARGPGALAHDVAGDKLVLTDAGDPAVADDGALLVLGEASRAVGHVRPLRTLRGPHTLLGDPTDVALDGAELRVVERSNGRGRLLVFLDALVPGPSDLAPARVRDLDAASALALEPATPRYAPEPSDLDAPDTHVAALLSIRAARASGAGGALRRHDPASLVAGDELATGFDLRGLDVDLLGDVYAGTATGRLLVLNRAAGGRDWQGGVTPARDRVVQTLELDDPRGVEVVGARGLVLVAAGGGDGRPAVQAYSTQAQAFALGAAPLFTLELPAAPWDLDYDGRGDRLFVALGDGTVAVFDALLDGAQRPTRPDRLLWAVTASAPARRASQDLRGLVHDARTDRLILVDHGAPEQPGLPPDGRLFVLDDASTAAGGVVPRVHLEGRATRLGDPVDVVYDGRDAYVADRAAGGVLLRFAGVEALDAPVRQDLPPAAFASAPAPGALVLVPRGLSPTRGGSLVGR